jgi:hypothetical protein
LVSKTLQITAKKSSGVAIACLVLGVAGCGGPEPIAAGPTNVTLMEEGAGRFFGAHDAPNCWTDIEVHEQMQPTESTNYSVSSVLYCVAPLAELNGDPNVSFADLTLTGRVIWGVPN